MVAPNIDTFEHDISEEIKTKEASIGDIASAGGDIGNAPVASQNSSTMLYILGGIVILIITIAVSYFGYTYYNKKVTPPDISTPVEIPQVNDTSLLFTISPSLPDAIGRFVSGVEKSPYGYAITLNSYAPVFVYMLKNEALYGEDIARVVGSPRDRSGPPFTFTDVTINNQNMRVGTSASSTVVYAFINSEALVIASSTENIIKLRSDILKR